MATYVLVHGSGSGGFIYRPVAKILREAGHTVYTPTLTGLGERMHLMKPGLGLDTHILDVANLIYFEDLRDVIIVGHSYTGMVITGAADRVVDRIRHVVYMDATIPFNGESQADVIPKAMALGKAESQMLDGELMTLVPTSSFHQGLRDNLSKHGHGWMIERCKHMSYHGCYETKLNLHNEEAFMKLPRTAIHALQVPWEDEQYKRMKACDNFWEIDTVHGLHIAEPEKTAELLLRLA